MVLLTEVVLTGVYCVMLRCSSQSTLRPKKTTVLHYETLQYLAGLGIAVCSETELDVCKAFVTTHVPYTDLLLQYRTSELISVS